MTTNPTPMFEALKEARQAATCAEVPIGAVVVNPKNGEIIARAHNLTEKNCDPTAHAEILALRLACTAVGAPRLPEYDLYVTLEPCAMCAAAIANARVRRLYFGAYDPKGGGIEQGARIFNQPTTHHTPDIYGGIDEAACSSLLKEFFEQRR